MKVHTHGACTHIKFYRFTSCTITRQRCWCAHQRPAAVSQHWFTRFPAASTSACTLSYFSRHHLHDTGAQEVVGQEAAVESIISSTGSDSTSALREVKHKQERIRTVPSSILWRLQHPPSKWWSQEAEASWDDIYARHCYDGSD